MHDPGADQSEQASALKAEAERLLDNGGLDKALARALRADGFFQSCSRALSSDRVAIQLIIAKIYLAKELPAQAEVHLRVGIKIWEAGPGKSLDQLFDLHILLSHALVAQGKHAQVVELVHDVAQAARSDLAESYVKTTPMLLDGYNSTVALRDYDSAARFMRLDVELHRMAIERNTGQEEANRVRVQSALRGQLLLGTALSMNGNHAEATKTLKEAEAEAKQAGPDALRDSISAHLGCAQVMAGQIQEAISTLTNVLDKLEEGSTNQTLTFTLMNLAAAYTMAGEPAKSEKALARSLRSSIEAGRFDHALASLWLRAEDLMSVGRLIEARESLEYAMRALDAHPDNFHSDKIPYACVIGQGLHTALGYREGQRGSEESLGCFAEGRHCGLRN